MEWLAFTSGLKPAIRRTTEPGQAEEVERRLARGAVVLRARELASLDGREQVVLYAARTEALAAALRAAESTILPGRVTAEDIPAAHRALGRALGFPACCVDAFCSRIARGVDRLAAGGPGGFSEDYAAAREAWVRAADARVNPMLMSCGAQLVPRVEVVGAVSGGTWRPSRWGEAPAARRVDLRPLADALAPSAGARAGATGRERQGSGDGRGARGAGAVGGRRSKGGGGEGGESDEEPGEGSRPEGGWPALATLFDFPALPPS